MKGLTRKALANSSPGVVATLGFKLGKTVNAESVGPSLVEIWGTLSEFSETGRHRRPRVATTLGWN
jgi:hypothetical protein